MKLALTYHIEGPRERPSAEIYDEVTRQVLLADETGYDYAWFSEHHSHVHLGHMPCPLLLALHLAGRTRRIQLGAAVICLNLHHPVEIAEQVAVADHLAGGRISPGFGSGSSPNELALFGYESVDEKERHRQFAESLRIIRRVWSGEGPRRAAEADRPGYDPPLPLARDDLHRRSWLAANSLDAAKIAGEGGFNMMFSYLRTPEQYEALYAAYREAGGTGMVAANRPVYVGESEDSAWRDAEPALRSLWRRFASEGKISRDTTEPKTFDPGNAPGQFLVGGPDSVADSLNRLHDRVPFDVINIEPRWPGFSIERMHASIRRFAELAAPRLRS